MNQICDHCGKEFELEGGGVLFSPGDDDECSPFTDLLALCTECDKKYEKNLAKS